MAANDTQSHYDALAESYNENWAYSPRFVEWMSRRILSRLNPEPHHRVADIGCGTGLYTRDLAEQAGRVVCVDPSANMLAQLPPNRACIPLRVSAENVVRGRAQLPFEEFDAILVKEAIHHVDHPGEVVRGLADLLSPRGRLLIVMLPTRIQYPLFAKALELFEESQPDPRDVAAAMETAGLRVELTDESFPLSFAKARYLRMVANRYMSLLSRFDDEQLAAGIAEIDAAHESDPLEFPDHFAFIRGVRP